MRRSLHTCRVVVWGGGPCDAGASRTAGGELCAIVVCLSVPCAAKGFACCRCCGLRGFCFVPTQASRLQQLYMCYWPEQAVVFGVRDGCGSMLGGMLTVVYIHSCVGACWACLQPRQAVCVSKGREWQQAAQHSDFACACCMVACAPVSMGCGRRVICVLNCKGVGCLGFGWLHTHKTWPLRCCLGRSSMIALAQPAAVVWVCQTCPCPVGLSV